MADSSHMPSATPQPPPAFGALPSQGESGGKSGRGVSGKAFGIGAAAGVVVSGLVVLALALAGVVGLTRAPGHARYEGPGFDTPEAAARAFLDGLANKDMDAMLATFAYESFAGQSDYGVLLNRLHTHRWPGSSASGCMFPRDDPLGQAANLEARRANVVGQTMGVLGTEVSSHLVNEFVPQDFPSDDPTAQVAAFQAQTQADFAAYTLGNVGPIASVSPDSVTGGKYSSAVNQSNIEQWLLPQYGLQSDDYADVVLTFERQGKKWAFAPSVGRYHGRWYVIVLQGNVSQLLGFSNLQAISPLE